MNIFVFKARALFTWIKPNKSQTHPMYGTVIFRMKGKCTLLKGVLSRQVLDSKFETRSSIIETWDLILESFENRDMSDCKLTFEHYWRWVVEQDFHWNFQVNVTWFSLVSLTELCSFWYSFKDLFTFHKFSWWTKLSLTIKTDDVTSGRSDVGSPRPVMGSSGENGLNNKFFE